MRLYQQFTHLLGSLVGVNLVPAHKRRKKTLSVERLEVRLLLSTQTDVWSDRFDVVNDVGNAFPTPKLDGQSYYKKTDSDSLGFGESNILSSYLAMYRATGDAGYLKQFVKHADAMIVNAKDEPFFRAKAFFGPAEDIARTDSDGLLGWGDFSPNSVNYLANGNFEKETNAALPSAWKRWQSSLDSIHRDPHKVQEATTADTVRLVPSSDPAHSDKNDVAISTTASDKWQVLESAVISNPRGIADKSYEPNTIYQLSFRGKADQANASGQFAGGRVEVVDLTARTWLMIYKFNNTEWQTHEPTFRMPSEPGHQISVRISNHNRSVPGQTAYFDDLKLVQGSEYAVDEGMIVSPLAEFASLVKNDPTLTTFRPKATSYVTFIRGNILPKWDNANTYRTFTTRFGSTGTFLRPDDGSLDFSNRSLPVNQSLALGRTYAWLYAYDGQAADSSKVKQLSNLFKYYIDCDGGADSDGLLDENSAYSWVHIRSLPGIDATLSESDFQAEDTSHANTDIAFAIAANRVGLGFSTAEMRGFVRTLNDVMWNKSWTAPKISGYVSGVNNVPNQLLTNGSFEGRDANDATLPAGWLRWNSTSSNAVLSSFQPHAGNLKATILSDGSGTQRHGFQRQLADYQTNKSTTITFWAKSNATAAGGYVDVYDLTTNTKLASRTINASTWQKFTLSFTTPLKAGNNLRIRLGLNDYKVAGGAVYFDDISVFQYLPARDGSPHLRDWVGLASYGGANDTRGIVDATFEAGRYWENTVVGPPNDMLTIARLIEQSMKNGVSKPLLTNGSFENRDANDATLPAGWLRWNSTSSNAVLSSFQPHAGNLKATILSDGSGTQRYGFQQQLLNYQTNKSTTITFWAKSNATAAGGYVEVYDLTTKTKLASRIINASTWQKFTLSFTTPLKAGNNLRIRLGLNDYKVAGGAVYFDDISVFQS